MKRHFVTYLFIAFIIGAGFSAVLTTQYGTVGSHDTMRTMNPATVFMPNTALAQSIGSDSIADVAEKSIDSVVNISSTKVITSKGMQSPLFDDPFFRRFFGPDFRNEQPREHRATSLGSGVIVSSDGIILTNNHVVENADELKVTLHDEREFDAEIVGTDPPSDVAVIRLIGDDIKGLKPITFGDSDRLRLGEIVLAIGNPFGLSHTVTMGIVSAKGRNFNSGLRITDYEDFIQTDAAINPGNSGGALINMKGELVGINTAIASRSGGSQGVGFAIPTNMARSIMDKLISDGKIVRGWLGVGIQDIDHDLAEALDLPSTDGVLITQVMEGSPAEKGGVKTQDIIVKVDGTDMKSSNQLRNFIAMLDPGKNVTVTVIRNGKKKNLRVKLGERPGSETLASLRGGGRSQETLDGLSIAALTEETRARFNIPDDIQNGVVVTTVEPGSNADDSGIRAGDVILEVNKKPVNTVRDFREQYDKKDTVLVYLYRQGSRFFAVIKKK